MKTTNILLLFSIFLLGGCANIGNSLKGNHYLSTQQYEEGVLRFQEEVKSEPDNEVANYYLGRFLLAEGQSEKALPYLAKAVSADPDDADYYFWLGVGNGAIGNEQAERKNYEQAIKQQSTHSKAHLYLGHLQLKAGQYEQALASYNRVLMRYPFNATAMYNRAICLKMLGRHTEEKKAWKKYLEFYPAGYLAIRATEHLNALGDFSFRNHYFGYRTITLTEIDFITGTEELRDTSLASLKNVGAVMANLKKGNLQIVVNAVGDHEIAYKRARSIQAYLLKNYTDIPSERLRISGFGTPEKISMQGREHVLAESVRLFMTDTQ